MKLYAPAAERNLRPITQVLEPWLPKSGRVLEIASGSGQHIVHWAETFPHLEWVPSDADEAALRSILAYRADAGHPNLAEPINLNVHEANWPIRAADMVICLNMIHIANWTATPALLSGAAQILETGKRLMLYGPFLIDGAFTSDSNRDFDQSLRMRNPQWGVRDRDEVARVATTCGFALESCTPMPANNFTLFFRRISNPPHGDQWADATRTTTE
jgi:hypothetical protein